MVKTQGRSHPAHAERRSGKDRRQRDSAPLGAWERRRNIEPRKPEVAELELTPSQWDALLGDPSTEDVGTPPGSPGS